MMLQTSARIFLVRHGETQWNAAGIYQGALDSPLTDRGVAQARYCGEILAAHVGDIDHVFASPLGRTQQTEAILRAGRDYPPTIWDNRLAEVTAGSWDGLSHIDIEAGWPGALDGSDAFDWYFRSPDGESYAAAMARVTDWLRGCEGTVLAVSHGLLGRLIRGAYLGLPEAETLRLPVPQDVVWRMENGAIEPLE